jgi:hypothetical protein
MDVNYEMRTSEHPPMADKSAVRAINQRLRVTGFMC